MFAPTYFAPTYYAASYFPPGFGGVTPPVTRPRSGGFRQASLPLRPAVVHASLLITLPELTVWAYASVDEDDIAILELL